MLPGAWRELGLNCPPGPAVVAGDRRALERALTNLVQNAIDHGGRRGVITVRAAPGRIEVRDQGEGIPVPQRDRVFEAFHRLQPQGRGAGLGLDLVQAIMRRHGGRVEVSDAPGGGVRFGLVFSVSARQESSGEKISDHRINRPADPTD